MVGLAAGAAVAAGLILLVVTWSSGRPESTRDTILGILFVVAALATACVCVFVGAWLTAKVLRRVFGVHISENVMLKEALSRLPCCGGCLFLVGSGVALLSLLAVALLG